jgi:cell division protein FtsL
MAQEQLQRPMTKSSRQTREITRRLKKLTEVQAAVGWGLILLVIALLGVIYLNQSSKIAAVGRHVQELRFEINTIQRQNSEIEREIAEAQSLSRIQKEAERMGFIRAQSIYVEYLVIPPFSSMTDGQDTRYVQSQAAAPPVETISKALLLTVEAAINDLMEGEASE